MGCFVNFGADYLEPGVIQYAGRGAVVVGEIDGRVTPRLVELHRALRDFEERAILTTNIWATSGESSRTARSSSRQRSPMTRSPTRSPLRPIAACTSSSP